MKQAFFLDRDGVINVEVDYLCEPERVEIIPGVAAALRKIHQMGYLAIVVTNQSGVARGMYAESDVMAVHQRIQQLLAAENAAVDAFYYCPHHRDFTGECSCRKPSPGMLLQAAREWEIDLRRSVMVGDRLSDIEAGRAAGCCRTYLVRTGYGEEVLKKCDVGALPVADDLAAAVDDWFSGQQPECEETGRAVI